MSRVFKLAAVVMLSLSLAAAPGDVAVVVGPDTPVDNLSFADVRKLFMGDRQYWNSNLRVTLLIRAPVARERDVVLKMIYGMTEAQFLISLICIPVRFFPPLLFAAERMSATCQSNFVRRSASLWWRTRMTAP